MKLLITTAAAHMYLDIYNGQQVNAFRPSVVEHTPFIATLIAAQKVELINGKLKDEATDEEFAKFFAESEDKELAVSSFISKYEDKPEEVKAPAPAKSKA